MKYDISGDYVTSKSGTGHGHETRDTADESEREGERDLGQGLSAK